MYEPIRGGTRGGQAEFKWADVSADKDREHYLGHSINAPTGRWQKNKDVHWYKRDLERTEAEKNEEIRKIKEAEADALAVALGFAPVERKIGESSSVSKPEGSEEVPQIKDQEKEERRRKKAERKEEKRLRKVRKGLRRLDRHEHLSKSRTRSPSHSRSRSPQLHFKEYDTHRPRNRSRSRSPPPRNYDQSARTRDYDVPEIDRERDSAKRRWEANRDRDRPGARWGRE